MREELLSPLVPSLLYGATLIRPLRGHLPPEMGRARAKPSTRRGDHGDGSCDQAQNLLVGCITEGNGAAEIAALPDHRNRPHDHLPHSRREPPKPAFWPAARVRRKFILLAK